jgi:hypothetical protein
MRAQGVRRLIALGTTSIKDPNDKFSAQFSIIINGIAVVARTAYKDFVAIGEVIRKEASDLDWTIVRVPILTNQESKTHIPGYVGDGHTGIYLSRPAFAAFVVDELKENKWINRSPLLSNA